MSRRPDTPARHQAAQHTAPSSAHGSVRSYGGEHQSHAHGHAQILYALQGRMELEVDGRAGFVDAACGMIIPAGCEHGYLAAPQTRIMVIDAPPGHGLERARSFAVPPALRRPGQLQPSALTAIAAASQLALALQAPSLQPRRALDLARLRAQVVPRLHESWPTERLAALCHLSVAQFHARFVELADQTPQRWLRALRLDAASALLARGLPLHTCALQCGYASASALAYALRRERGIGARQLR